MSNAKIRARRIRRARRAWDKSTGFVNYFDIEMAIVARGLTRPPTNAERQAEGADASMRALSRQLWSAYPGAMQIHDEFIIDGPASEADALKKAAGAALRAWHKNAGFGVRPKFAVDFCGDPVNWADMSLHRKSP